MKGSFVVPSWDGLEILREALLALQQQTVACEIVVVDNGSTDGTADAVAEEFPEVVLVRLQENVGFGRAVNLGAASASGDVLLVVNNDAVCAPDFAERMLAPFADPAIGMAAGVLTQRPHPDRVDSAGIELDVTVGSWDLGWNQPVASLGGRQPVGPCGGAAAYRLDAFKDVGGFDDAFFAYWEDVDLALRLRLAGHACVRAPEARALHKHGQTVGAASPRQRQLEAFGRAFVLARYRVARRGLRTRAAIALLDWPVLAVHLLVRREAAPIRERWRGTRSGLARPPLRAPFELATVTVRDALRRQLDLLRLRATGGLPAHFADASPGAR
jgi:GT2 family glycosyltransferase